MTTKIKLWQWPNILAIDAGLLSAAWLWAFAEVQSTQLTLGAYTVLAMSVWLTYVADRLFDVSSRAESRLLSDRHRFAKQDQPILWLLWGMVLLTNISLALVSLSATQMQKGLSLLFLCLAYTACSQALSKRFFPKELLVALIFTGGTQVFLPELSAWPCLAAFTLLCLANCLCISWKEHYIDAELQVQSLSNFVDKIWLYPLLLVSAALSGTSSYTAALLPAIFAVLILQLNAKRLGVESFRVLCDAALFIGPLCYLFVSMEM